MYKISTAEKNKTKLVYLESECCETNLCTYKN